MSSRLPWMTQGLQAPVTRCSSRTPGRRRSSSPRATATGPWISRRSRASRRGRGHLALAPLAADGLHPRQLAVLFLADHARPTRGATRPRALRGSPPASRTVDVSFHESGVGQAFAITSTGPGRGLRHVAVRRRAERGDQRLPPAAHLRVGRRRTSAVHAWEADPLTTVVHVSAGHRDRGHDAHDVADHATSPATAASRAGQKGQPYMTHAEGRAVPPGRGPGPDGDAHLRIGADRRHGRQQRARHP